MEKRYKRKIKTCIFLTEREEEMLGELMQADGHMWYPDTLRACIRGWHAKRFPIYTKSVRAKDEKNKMTDEEYCVKRFNGVVDEKDQVCRIKDGVLSHVIPLGLIKEREI